MFSCPKHYAEPSKRDCQSLTHVCASQQGQGLGGLGGYQQGGGDLNARVGTPPLGLSNQWQNISGAALAGAQYQQHGLGQQGFNPAGVCARESVCVYVTVCLCLCLR